MEEKLKLVLAEVLQAKPDSIHDGLRFKSHPGYSSVSVLGLLAELEDSFGFQLTKRDLDKMDTVSDLTRWLKERLNHE